tara:strand:- start:310 stop:1233 length:924 start_codon:yes stop_codon:yes gene_type:complete
MKNKKISDINKNKLIRLLPKNIQLYFLLLRIDRPIGWWLLVLPSWWVIFLNSSNIFVSLKLIFYFTLGAILMRGGGCIINDLWDYKFDQKVFRTSSRPLASGDLSFFSAYIILFIVLFLSFLILLQLTKIAWLVAIFSFPLIIFYPFSKRITNYPQFILGLVFSWGVPLGFASTHGIIYFENFLYTFYLYIGTVFWVFGYDSIYSIQDKDDDMHIGVKSTALTFGKNLKYAVFISYFIAILFWILASNSFIWYTGVFVVSIHMIWQISKVELNNPHLALKLFKSNRDLGLILALAAFLDMFNKIYIF